MSDGKPTHTSLTPDELERIREHFDLPTVERVVPTTVWTHANFRLEFARGSGQVDLMLRRVAAPPGYDTLENERAALTVLRHAGIVPVVERFDILPPGLIEGRAALTSFLRGVSGGELLADDDRGPRIAQRIGEVVAALEDHAVATWGRPGEDARFAGTADSWREGWRSYAAWWAGRARAGGVDPDGLIERLERALDELLPELDAVDHFAIVHNDLHPSNLLFDREAPGLPLVGVVDWESAMAGDPLAEWALFLDLDSGELLGHVVRGYGRERAAALRGANAAARLRAYWLTRALARLGFAASALFRGDGGRRRAHAIELARHYAHAALAPGGVQQRLEAALAASAGWQAVGIYQPAEPRILLRRSLESLRHAPVPDGSRLGVWSAAMACALIANRVEGSLARRWLAVGDRALDAINDQDTPHERALTVTPEELAGRAVAALSEQPSREAVYAAFALALALRGVAELDGEWSAALGHGLAGLPEPSLGHDPGSGGEGALTVHDAVLAAAACAVLVELAPVPGLEMLRERLRAVLAAGAAPAARERADGVRLAPPPVELDQPEQVRAALLELALLELEGDDAIDADRLRAAARPERPDGTRAASPRVFHKQAPEVDPVTEHSMSLFRLGELCDHDCPMCTNSGLAELRYFDEQELRRRADFLSAHGFRRVMLTGGEPTLHKYFWELAAYLQELGIVWDLNTHGGMFAAPGVVERALHHGLQRVIVSLHSHRAEVSCAMSGTTPLQYERTVQGIRNLRTADVDLMINCVLGKPNLGTLTEYVVWCRRELGERVALKLTFPNLAGRGADWDGIRIRYRDVADELRAVAREARRLDVDVSFEAVPNCIHGDPDAEDIGRIGFGETHYLEDRTGREILSIRWIDSEQYVYGEPCTRCAAVDRCPGLSRPYALAFGLDELVPFDESVGDAGEQS